MAQAEGAWKARELIRATWILSLNFFSPTALSSYRQCPPRRDVRHKSRDLRKAPGGVCDLWACEQLPGEVQGRQRGSDALLLEDKVLCSWKSSGTRPVALGRSCPGLVQFLVLLRSG